MLVPTVIERSNNGERAYDIYSRLLKDRIIILCGEIDDVNCNTVVAQLLYLDSLSHDDISILLVVVFNPYRTNIAVKSAFIV